MLKYINLSNPHKNKGENIMNNMTISVRPSECSIGWKDQHTNYAVTNNLETRIFFHTFPSSQTIKIWDWVRDIYYQVMPEKGNSLEVGCGTGAFWNKKFLEDCLKKGKLILTDYSEAMTNKCKDNPIFQNQNDLTFENQDASKLSYDDGAFSLILSHFMMYHVEPVEKGISELSRILTDDGVAVFVTTDELEAFKEIWQLLDEVDPVFANVRSSQCSQKFCRSNAPIYLKTKFNVVEEKVWEETMFLTNEHPIEKNVSGAESLLAWLRSLQDIQDLQVSDEVWQQVAEAIQRKIESSGITGMPITRNRVAYVCKNPIRG